MSAEPVAQPCEVCGVETVQRCSSCAKAGIDLFFCSTDHQKLVWSAHKTVCGPGKAHPFAVMPLTDSELSWVLEHLDKKSVGHSETLRQEIAGLSSSGEPAEVIARHLAGDMYEQSELAEKLLLVSWLRGSAGNPGNPNYRNARDLLHAPEKGYFDRLMSAQQGAFRLSSVTHALGQQGIMDLAARDSIWLRTIAGNKDQQLNALHEGASARFLDWIRAGAGTGDARMARALAAFFPTSTVRISVQPA